MSMSLSDLAAYWNGEGEVVKSIVVGETERGRQAVRRGQQMDREAQAQLVRRRKRGTLLAAGTGLVATGGIAGAGYGVSRLAARAASRAR